MDFDSWYDIFVERCHKLGYTGAIDRGTFKDEFEMNPDSSPEQEAEKFVKEMQSE